jgi:acetamidase/formamidase
VASATLYLPVTVPGALLCLGDGHAAQGDGEVGGTAIERDDHRGGPRPAARAASGAGHPRGHARRRITFGFHEDLNQAMGNALGAMLSWLQVTHELDRPTALALASPAVDLRITQVANDTWGVHAVLPTGALTHQDRTR